MMRSGLVFAAVAASATCGPKPSPMPWDVQLTDAGVDVDGGTMPVARSADCRPCETWGAVEIRGPLPAQLDELSGLAASRKHPGIVYAHNDTGDTARLFALDTFGRLVAEIRLPGAQAIDWEDMAAGPCDDGPAPPRNAAAGAAPRSGELPGQPCLFLGDIGDNLRRRNSYVVYRIVEPQLPAPGELPEVSAPFDRLPFIYPGGARHNAETLLVSPTTGDLYIVTKETAGTPSHVFRFPKPLTPDSQMTLIELGSASVPQATDVLVTAGAIHPCGDSVLLRLYNRIVELRAVPDAGLETAFTRPPVELPSPIDEPQGEAITWGADGQSYFTASEHTGQSLHRVQCVRAP